MKLGKDKGYKVNVKKLVYLSIFIFFISLFLFLLYLGKLKSIKKIEEGQLANEKNELKIESIKSNNLPEEFPKEFPLFLKANLNECYVNQGEKIIGVSCAWETKQGVNEVYSFYSFELPKIGYEVSVVSKNNDSYTLSFQKDKLSGFLGIAKKTEEDTAISITLGIMKNND